MTIDVHDPHGRRSSLAEARNHTALTEAFGANRTAIHALARRLCGEDAAADVTQEVFLRAWRKPDLFDAARGSLRQYLLIVTRGVAIDHLRRDTSRRARDVRTTASWQGTSSDGSDALIDGEDAGRVTSALAELNDREREAILAAFYDEMTYRQVASRLGIPEGTAKSRIRLGLQKLRLELGDMSGDPGRGDGDDTFPRRVR